MWNNIVIAQDDYQKWLSKENEKYSKFLSDEDKKFTEFLRKEWVQIGLHSPESNFTKPKPVVPQTFQPSDIISKAPDKKESKPPPIQYNIPAETEIKINPEPLSAAKDEGIEVIPGVDLTKNNLSAIINFYGSNITYHYTNQLSTLITPKLDKDAIADFWIEMGSGDYNSIIQQAVHYQNKYKLNDWGYLTILYEMARKLYPSKVNERYLFCWFILNKSGYAAKVGYSGDKIGLMIASKDRLFGRPYYYQKDNDRKFYSVTIDPRDHMLDDEIIIYKEDLPSAQKLFDFNITVAPNLPLSAGSRKIKFTFSGEEYSIELKYNKNLIKFYDSYPASDLAVYFNSSPSLTAQKSLLDNLTPYLKGKNPYQAVSFLLHFVQYATEYKIDQGQFGREKSFFVEESIHYTFSDCEDRSVLFAYLVREFLGLDVIGLDFPEHIATAVRFNEDIPGSYFIHKNKKYIVCDPTYLGAGIGKMMPEYIGVKPEFIEISHKSK